MVQNQESPDEIRRLGTSASTNFCFFILPTYLLLVLTVLCSVVGSTLSVFPRFVSIFLAVENQISHFSHFFPFLEGVDPKFMETLTISLLYLI